MNSEGGLFPRENHKMYTSWVHVGYYKSKCLFLLKESFLPSPTYKKISQKVLTSDCTRVTLNSYNFSIALKGEDCSIPSRSLAMVDHHSTLPYNLLLQLLSCYLLWMAICLRCFSVLAAILPFTEQAKKLSSIPTSSATRLIEAGNFSHKQKNWYQSILVQSS